MAVFVYNGPVRNGISVSTPNPATNYIKNDRVISLANIDGLTLAAVLDGKYRAEDWFIKDSLTASSADVASGTYPGFAQVTYAAAGSARSHAFEGIAWGYDGTPTGGYIQIEDGSGNIVFKIPILNGGAGFHDWPHKAFEGSVNTALIITLAAGGSGITGYLSVKGKRIV